MSKKRKRKPAAKTQSGHRLSGTQLRLRFQALYFLALLAGCYWILWQLTGWGSRAVAWIAPLSLFNWLPGLFDQLHSFELFSRTPAFLWMIDFAPASLLLASIVCAVSIFIWELFMVDPKRVLLEDPSSVVSVLAAPPPRINHLYDLFYVCPGSDLRILLRELTFSHTSLIASQHELMKVPCTPSAEGKAA